MKRRNAALLAGMLTVTLTASLAGCSTADTVSESVNAAQKEAMAFTAEINSSYYELLDFSDEREAEFAVKGLLAAPKELELKDEEGNVIWSQKAYAFLEDAEKSPDSVNPSLWQNTKNNHAYGLFRVTDKIYQVRGYDMSNLTLIKGDTGWIVFDPLMSVECAEAAMQLVNENMESIDGSERPLPVKAVVISHPHIDHYGGITGIMTAQQAGDPKDTVEQQIAKGKIPIIVPKGFTEHAVSENVYAGTAMSRRASYQYGTYLEAGEKGKMSIGIGMGQSLGTTSFILPSFEVESTGETLTVDGVEMEFQMTPGTEAPAEMNTYFPEQKALWMAENCTATLHNLYTLRGAQVRDGNAWAKYIAEALSLYGDKVDVTFQSHNWPHWGNETVRAYMENTAAIYKFINDQTLLYINQGYTSDEISNRIALPPSLEKVWYTRQYYGTLAHDAKAVYQKYMGWYDANPVNLNPLTPTDEAKKWVEYLGDTDRVLKMAKEDFEKGEYRWVAEITNVLVYADPENKEARLLCADALEQLGYQSESGTWRNAYLTGAMELREGNTSASRAKAASSSDMMQNMTAEMILDYMGIHLNKEASFDVNAAINVSLTDTGEIFKLRWFNGVLLPYSGIHAETPDASITCVKNDLLQLMSGQVPPSVQVEGDGEIIKSLAQNLKNQSNRFFNIVEP